MTSPAGLEEEPKLPASNEKRATFIEHLDELRTRLMRSLVFLTIGWIIGFYITPMVYDFLSDPLTQWKHQMPKGHNLLLAFDNVTGPFFLRFKISLLLGLLLTLPLLMRELWAFISPGLTPQERRALRFIAPFSAFLFFFGASLGYYILPAAFRWFLSFLKDFPDASLFQNPAQYALFVVKMMLAFGLGFQLPVVMMFLAKVGIATPEFMWKYARHAVLVIAFLSALLTPSGDALSMLAIGLPMVILYFLSITLVTGIARKRKREQDRKE